MSHSAHSRAIISLMATPLAITGLVTGCAAPREATKESAASGTTTSAPPAPTEGDSPYDSTEPPAVEETTTPPEEEPGVAKVGATQWFTYEDGLKVQVTKLARYKAGQATATGKTGDPAVVLTVTIRNGTKATADLSLTTVKLAYGANGNEGEQIFDENHGSGFSGSATPGKAKTAKFAFLVPKGRQVLDIEVQPGFLDYESVHFEGSVK